MGIFSLILLIIQIFIKLPDIWALIKDIMELIRGLRGGAKMAALGELKAVLVRYKDVDRSDKKQVAEKGHKLRMDLQDLKAKLANVG